MLVSLNWLKRYVDIDAPLQELEDRLSMSGLNHESTEQKPGDTAIDLEVTSNRGDCNGHIGVAREIAVLYDLPLQVPDPQPPAVKSEVSDAISVDNEFPAACDRYTARVVRGVKVGPSPAWLIDALTAIDVKPVNNIVDITNFVMFECGQPLHAFDLDKVQGGRIIVRRAHKGEEIEAIDHKSYPLEPDDCVIADGSRPVAIAGVMGGAATEVSETTANLLIESASFTPLNIRRTARRLKLHSPSSYRFERRVDPVGVEWASRRCCELILEIAGGELLDGVVDTVDSVPPRTPVDLRFDRMNSLLGMQISADEAVHILEKLGCQPSEQDEQKVTVVPPSWRHDLTREVDLIEEVARIHGYEQIPDDSPIPIISSAPRPLDEVLDKVRHVLTAAGISEAMTPSVVTERDDALLSPWTDRPALKTLTPMLKGARTLRRSILPSLLRSRRANLATSGREANLFEVAHIYLPREAEDELPDEQYMLAIAAGMEFLQLKGVIETLAARLGIDQRLGLRDVQASGCDADQSVELQFDGARVGFLAAVDDKLCGRLKLPGPICVCELVLPEFVRRSRLVPQFQEISAFPSINRDINLVVDEEVRWEQLRHSVTAAVGEPLADLRYVETYRDPKRDGKGKKRILMTLELQRSDRTLTGDEADELVGTALRQCETEHGAKLLA